MTPQEMLAVFFSATMLGLFMFFLLNISTAKGHLKDVVSVQLTVLKFSRVMRMITLVKTMTY